MQIEAIPSVLTGLLHCFWLQDAWLEKSHTVFLESDLQTYKESGEKMTLIRVDTNKCTYCNACISECPAGLIVTDPSENIPVSISNASPQMSKLSISHSKT